jgi:hypothetical protein
MNEAEFSVYYHSLMFKVACHEKKAAEFQTFFEAIMQKHDPTFIVVEPSGDEGDWKCDGFSQATGTIFQCYAPKDLDLTAAKAAKKIRDDFAGAKDKWKKKMLEWTFVWSGDGRLPPQATDALLDLKSDNPKFPIHDMGREALWQIVKNLPELERVALLGVVPSVEQATETTAAEVQTLLNFLARQHIDLLTDTLDLTELSEKISKNNLSIDVQALIQTGLPVARVAQNYTRKHPDSDFQSLIANALASKYRELKISGASDPDYIFWEIVSYVSQGGDKGPKTFWAAVGIVTLIFQLCDIFEK